MKILDITKENLRNIVANNKVIGRGSFGIIYQIDDDTLFKFNYKNFIQDFENINNKIDLTKLGDITKSIILLKHINNCVDGRYIEQKMVKLLEKKDSVKLTALTQGAVFVDDCCVGYLLKYHKDMIDLGEYLCNKKLSKSARLEIYSNIKNAVNELVANDIFIDDLSIKNVLINPKTKQIQLIDFEDCCTDVRQDRPKRLLNSVKQQLAEFYDYLVGGKNSEDNLYF